MTEHDAPPEPTTPEEIRADIAATRAELSETVDELAAKLDVKHQVGAKARSIGDSVSTKAAQAKSATPQPVQHAIDQAGATLGPHARKANDAIAPHRAKIVLGATAARSRARGPPSTRRQPMIKVFYKPFGLLASILGGLLAGQIFTRAWSLAAGETDPPDATDRDTTWKEVLISAAVQGAIFGGVKVLIDRPGATSVERATGSWPGNDEPRHEDGDRQKA